MFEYGVFGKVLLTTLRNIMDDLTIFSLVGADLLSS